LRYAVASEQVKTGKAKAKQRTPEVIAAYNSSFVIEVQFVIPFNNRVPCKVGNNSWVLYEKAIMLNHKPFKLHEPFLQY
jgi:hypothetical protein